MNSIVVVGASLAGLRAVEALRRAGYDGRLTLVGDEERLPYDRPPLSKEVLQGTWEPERATLRAADDYDDLDLDLRLGRRATRLDLATRQVVLDDDQEVGFDGLVIATGATPRLLPGAPPPAGVHTLRTLDDSLAIRDAITGGARLVVVGAGFIGAEVAASARHHGCDVTVLEALPAPLSRVLGEEMGRACGALHADHGVDLRCGVGVAGFEGADRVTGVRLVDGGLVAADVVVVGVGVAPQTGWLEGSGLTIDDGVVCDERCFSAPGVVAAGDVARWHNPRFEEVMRVEHWTNAAEQGMAAARNLLAGPDAAEPFAPVPYFWSDQYDTTLQLAGRCGSHDEVRVVHGSPEERNLVALYGQGGRLTAVLGFGQPRLVNKYRRLIAEGASWETALASG